MNTGLLTDSDPALKWWAVVSVVAVLLPFGLYHLVDRGVVKQVRQQVSLSQLEAKFPKQDGPQGTYHWNDSTQV